jgi:hypothetical protein
MRLKNSILKLIGNAIFARPDRNTSPEVSAERVYGYMHLRNADSIMNGPRHEELTNGEGADRTSSTLDKQMQLCRS